MSPKIKKKWIKENRNMKNEKKNYPQHLMIMESCEYGSGQHACHLNRRSWVQSPVGSDHILC